MPISESNQENNSDYEAKELKDHLRGPEIEI